MRAIMRTGIAGVKCASVLVIAICSTHYGESNRYRSACCSRCARTCVRNCRKHVLSRNRSPCIIASRIVAIQREGHRIFYPEGAAVEYKLHTLHRGRAGIGANAEAFAQRFVVDYITVRKSSYITARSGANQCQAAHCIRAFTTSCNRRVLALTICTSVRSALVIVVANDGREYAAR